MSLIQSTSKLAPSDLESWEFYPYFDDGFNVKRSTSEAPIFPSWVMQLPLIPSVRTKPEIPESNEDVRFIRRNQKNYLVPEGGVVLPASISLPLATDPKPTIAQFGKSLGISMPSSYNRQSLINRMGEFLRSLGYIQSSTNKNTYTRVRPVNLQPEGGRGSESLSTAIMEEAMHLPETISYEIFRTIDTMTEFIRNNNLNKFIRTGSRRLKNDIISDMREFLTEYGYAIDPHGNFVRRGGAVINGDLEFNDLITKKEYISLLESPGKIYINQVDLMRLNITLNVLSSRLAKRRWRSFENFVQEVSQSINVPVPVVWLASLLIKLQHETNATYTAILREIGDVRTHRRMEDRIHAIYEYIRQKIHPIPRTYHMRESFKGQATTTMTLQEAIKGGYQIDENQYKDQINNLLNRREVPDTHRNFFIQFIQQYPDTYDVISGYVNYGDSFAFALIRLYYPEIPGMVQQLYAYAVNQPLVFTETPEKSMRRQQIAALSRLYMESLYEIYSTRDVEMILDMTQNPLELYLTAISKVKVDQLPALVAGFGMLLPEHLLNRDRRRYVLQFIHQYRDIITRPPDTPPISQITSGQAENVIDFIASLRRYTDQEITTHFGYLAGFENRNSLVRHIFRNISEEGFMIYKEINPNAAINTETTLLISVKDLINPYLVFGTPFRYRVLELDELILAFHEVKNDNQEITGFKFTKIGGLVNESYTVGQVSYLQSLLPVMGIMNEQLSTLIDKILKLIRSGIIRTMKRNDEIDAIIREVKRSPLQTQKLVKEIFYKIFYAGMYMRKWKGPGTQYPVASASTRGGGDPQPKSIFTLGEVLELMNELRLANSQLSDRIKNIPEVDYQTRADEIIIKSHVHLFDIVDIVIKGQQCIRVASRHFVLTANYYISVMFGEIIPDFDPHSVDPIS